MPRKRSGGVGTAASRSARRDAKVREAGGKVISVRLTADAAKAIEVARKCGMSQDKAIGDALLEVYMPWKVPKP